MEDCVEPFADEPATDGASHLLIASDLLRYGDGKRRFDRKQWEFGLRANAEIV